MIGLVLVKFAAYVMILCIILGVLTQGWGVCLEVRIDTP
jgi:hypothetical protein